MVETVTFPVERWYHIIIAQLIFDREPLVMRLRLSLLTILVLALICPTGCGPALSESDLGTPVFEIPKIPGADKPYRMPQLEPTHEKENDKAAE
jgi:hypothetical protein